MTEVLQANVFFVIASIATVVFCLLVTMILFQVYKITKLIRNTLERIESASDVVAEDVAHIRELISGGNFVSSVIGFMMGQKRRRSRKHKTTEVED